MVMSRQAKELYEFGPFRIDVSERLLSREGQNVPLTPKAFDTLLVLVENRGHLLEKDELMQKLWPNTFVEEANLTNNISQLRKALGEDKGEHRHIETVPRRGYRFVAEVEELSGDPVELIVEERTRVTLQQEEEVSTADCGSQIANSGRIAPPSNASGVLTALAPPEPSAIGKRGRIAIVAGAVLVLATAVTFIILTQRPRGGLKKAAPPPLPFQQITIKRLTVNGTLAAATLSPDGKLFAYVLDDNEKKQSLWLGHVDGGDPLQLRPPGELFYLNPIFSPDGSSLYFAVAEDYASDSTLYRIPVFGGVAEKVKEKVRHRITFSPDGKQFAFVRHDGAGRRSVLVIADTIGTAERELAYRPGNLSFFPHSPSWSPDGSAIAVGAVNDESGQKSAVFVVTLADGTIKPLTARAWKDVRRTEWLSDASGLISVASEGISHTDAQLWHVSYPDGEVRRIITDLNNYGSSGVSLSADNKSLLAVRGQHQSNIWIAPADNLSEAKQITSDLLGRMNGWLGLDWTPGGRLVFTAFVDQSQTLWTVDADGSNKKQLLQSGYTNIRPAVTGDGRYVVFESDRSGSSEIWRASVDGSDLKQLTAGGNNWQPHVTPDGKWVVYKSSGDGVGALWRLSIDGGTPVRLTEKAASAPGVSPDGKYIACAYYDGKTKLAIVPIEGGPPVKLFDVPRLANLRYGMRWTHDGLTVTYRDWANGIWKQSVDGGEPRRLEGLPQEKLFAYGWSRDGKLFAFTRGLELAEVVLIRDFR